MAGPWPRCAMPAKPSSAAAMQPRVTALNPKPESGSKGRDAKAAARLVAGALAALRDAREAQQRRRHGPHW